MRQLTTYGSVHSSPDQTDIVSINGRNHSHNGVENSTPNHERSDKRTKGNVQHSESQQCFSSNVLNESNRKTNCNYTQSNTNQFPTINYQDQT